jgi:hypothetical protein
LVAEAFFTGEGALAGVAFFLALAFSTLFLAGVTAFVADFFAGVAALDFFSGAGAATGA